MQDYEIRIIIAVALICQAITTASVLILAKEALWRRKELRIKGNRGF